MGGAPTTTKLWDYGWIRHDVVNLSPASTAEELISQYCAAPSFQLSFLQSEKDESGLHGPFVAAQVSSADFLPLPIPDIPAYIESIAIAHDPKDDSDAHAVILKVLQETLASRETCLALRFTEASEEQFHGWGFVFSVFREILFPNLKAHGLDRFVIGYD